MAPVGFRSGRLASAQPGDVRHVRIGQGALPGSSPAAIAGPARPSGSVFDGAYGDYSAPSMTANAPTLPAHDGRKLAKSMIPT